MKLSDLITVLNELEDAGGTCNRCGMCQAVCPVFSVTRFEGDVARGKLVLVDGLRRELLKDPKRVLERLNRCLLCGACERSCSRRVPLMDILIRARMMITEYTGLSPIKKMLFRLVLTRPRLFEKIFRQLARVQGVLFKKASGQTGIRETRGITRFLKGRHTLPFPPQSFRAQRAFNFSNPASAPGKKVVFFTGCLIDKVMPHIGFACMKVLSAVGADVTVLEDELCCGIPALASGDRESFKRLVAGNLGTLGTEADETIVTACATCTSTLTGLWPIHADPENPELNGRISRISGKTFDITEFVLMHSGKSLVDLRFKQVGEEPVTVYWHDPCHLKGKGQALVLARQLLDALPGFRRIEWPGADGCCGSGGSFNLEHYDLSARIGDKKMRAVQESGAEMIVTSCPACMLQMTDLAARLGVDLPVRHLMELVADSLDR